MDRLPDELLLRIFSLLAKDTWQLVQLESACQRFCRITQDSSLWYLAFRENYPTWSHNVGFASRSQPLIDWKDFMLHIAKQNHRAQSFLFDFVPDETNAEYAVRKIPQKRKLSVDGQPEQQLPQLDNYYPPPFRILDPLVVDIDRVTKTGIVATGKHRREQQGQHGQRSEHKILFWEYPSWRLLREFDLSFAPAETSCQITGIQTIRMYNDDYDNDNNGASSNSNSNRTHKVRFFSLAVGQPILLQQIVEDGENDDRVDLWQTILIYRLFDNGATQCVAHVDMDGQLLGRDVFFFSEASWGRSSDGSEADYARQPPPQERVEEWMKIVAPEYGNFDPRYTVFMLAIGPDYPRVSGCSRLVRFDVRGERNILDPTAEPVLWDTNTHRFVPIYRSSSDASRFPSLKSSIHTAGLMLHRQYGPPAAVVARIPMGRKISCMIHFRYPPQLNHLICTGSYVTDQLTVFDWRFGVKVGVLPWRTYPTDDNANVNVVDVLAAPQAQEHNNINPPRPPSPQPIGVQPPDIDDDLDLDDDDQSVVPPWGLEATMVLPPYWSDEPFPVDAEDYAQRGLRLIAVGDNRNDKLEIKVWDITYILRAAWRPLDVEPEDPEIQSDQSWRFFWWRRGTTRLKRLALKMLREPEHLQLHHHQLQVWDDDLRQHVSADRGNLGGGGGSGSSSSSSNSSIINNMVLPYSPPDDKQTMILVHAFDKSDTNDMPVRYTAYNVLRTSLFLLTEEGKITVMDIETGRRIGTVENVVGEPRVVGPQRQVRGIDVNVVGNNEIVVTSRQGLLHGSMI